MSSTEICEVPGCDRPVTTLREQRSGDVLRVCGEPHAFDRPSPFVLDRDENPHPRLREHALMLRRAARATDDPMVGAVWLGYTDCACDATGWNAETWNAWLDQYDDFDPELIGHKDATTPPAVSQRVEIRR